MGQKLWLEQIFQTSPTCQPFGSWGYQGLDPQNPIVPLVPGDDGSWMCTGSHQLRGRHGDLQREVAAILDLAEDPEGCETKVQRYESRPPIIKHPLNRPNGMWKFPTKPWFLRGCLVVVGGWD